MKKKVIARKKNKNLKRKNNLIYYPIELWRPKIFFVAPEINEKL